MTITPATPAGTLAALGTAVLLGGILAAAGSFGYQPGVSDDTVSIAALATGICRTTPRQNRLVVETSRGKAEASAGTRRTSS